MMGSGLVDVDTSTEVGGRVTAVEVVVPGEQADVSVNGPSSAMLSWRRLETPPPTGTFSCIHTSVGAITRHLFYPQSSKPEISDFKSP